jgi:hypothetical protein
MSLLLGRMEMFARRSPKFPIPCPWRHKHTLCDERCLGIVFNFHCRSGETSIHPLSTVVYRLVLSSVSNMNSLYLELCHLQSRSWTGGCFERGARSAIEQFLGADERKTANQGAGTFITFLSLSYVRCFDLRGLQSTNLSDSNVKLFFRHPFSSRKFFLGYTSFGGVQLDFEVYMRTEKLRVRRYDDGSVSPRDFNIQQPQNEKSGESSSLGDEASKGCREGASRKRSRAGETQFILSALLHEQTEHPFKPFTLSENALDWPLTTSTPASQLSSFRRPKTTYRDQWPPAQQEDCLGSLCDI